MVQLVPHAFCSNVWAIEVADRLASHEIPADSKA